MIEEYISYRVLGALLQAGTREGSTSSINKFTKLWSLFRLLARGRFIGQKFRVEYHNFDDGDATGVE